MGLRAARVIDCSGARAKKFYGNSYFDLDDGLANRNIYVERVLHSDDCQGQMQHALA
jgi:hypothetical protein